jgi:hypothetical protein
MTVAHSRSVERLGAVEYVREHAVVAASRRGAAVERPVYSGRAAIRLEVSSSVIRADRSGESIASSIATELRPAEGAATSIHTIESWAAEVHSMEARMVMAVPAKVMEVVEAVAAKLDEQPKRREARPPKRIVAPVAAPEGHSRVPVHGAPIVPTGRDAQINRRARVVPWREGYHRAPETAAFSRYPPDGT